MAESSIQWVATPRADGTFAPGYTFNPWVGCTKVSAGCRSCYAEVDTFARVSKSRGLPLWGANAHRHVTRDDNWKKPVRWNREAAAMGERRKVFCASLSDVFEARDDLDVHRERLWKLIESTSALDWLLLTKRPEEIMRRIPERWRRGLPPWVWIGTTVENQEMAAERIPHLLRVPARVRFLSVEPMLEDVDLRDVKVSDDRGGTFCDPLMVDDQVYGHKYGRISWIIVGGESGTSARPFDIDAARTLVKQCQDAGTAVFMKQLGAHVIWDGMCGPGEHWPIGTRTEDRMIGRGWRVRLRDGAGGDMDEWPEDLRVRQFPEVAP